MKGAIILANEADPDEMQHYTAFHLDLCSLPKYQITIFRHANDKQSMESSNLFFTLYRLYQTFSMQLSIQLMCLIRLHWADATEQNSVCNPYLILRTFQISEKYLASGLSWCTYNVHSIQSAHLLCHITVYVCPPKNVGPLSTHRVPIEVRENVNIRNQYNQAPHLTQDTNGKVTTSQLDITNESQEVSPFPAVDQKATTNRQENTSNTKHK